MIKVMCKYEKLSDIANLCLDNYRNDVAPLDYDFYLKAGALYEVLGVTCRSSIPWLYIIRHDENNRIHTLPAVLFDFNWQKVPESWCMRINGPLGENIELLPEKLASIEDWFERYIDEDADILNLLKNL